VAKAGNGVEGLSQDRIYVTESELLGAAIETVVPIVAQHKKFAGRNGEGAKVIQSRFRGPFSRYLRLLQLVAIHNNLTIAANNSIAGQPDHSFHERNFWLDGTGENNQVAMREVMLLIVPAIHYKPGHPS
jgi:hypothetical protein